MQIEIISNSPVFTKNLGKIFSRILLKGNIILFTGELGGGKTTFISGLAEGLGLAEKISSPSFTILNEYRVDNHTKLIHADLYRLENINEIDGIGLDDYFYNGNSIICVEWGDKIKDYIRREFLEINLNYLMDENNLGKDTGTKRKIIFKSVSRYWDLKLEEFKKTLRKADNSII